MKHTKIEQLPTDKAYQLFTCKRVGSSEIQVDYELILPLKETDCRGTFDNKGRKDRPKSYDRVWLDTKNKKRIPLGRTKIGTDRKNYPFNPHDGEIDLPFRDGAHSGWDNEMLGGLNIYYQTETTLHQLHPAKSPAA